MRNVNEANCAVLFPGKMFIGHPGYPTQRTVRVVTGKSVEQLFPAQINDGVLEPIARSCSRKSAESLKSESGNHLRRELRVLNETGPDRRLGRQGNFGWRAAISPNRQENLLHPTS